MRHSRLVVANRRLKPANHRHRTRLSVLMVMGALALSLAIPALASATSQWYINGAPITSSKTVTWKGKLTVNLPYQGGGKFSVTCEDSGSGVIKPAGAGEQKSWSFTKCFKAGVGCWTLGAVEANKLPWKTQLFSSEGTIFQEYPTTLETFRTRQLTIHCKSLEGKSSVYACYLEHEEPRNGFMTSMKNLSEGTVSAELSSKRRPFVSCETLSGEEPHFENPELSETSQTITPESGSLEVK